MGVTIEDIEALRSELAELPQHQPKQVSKQEAVALLAGEIAAAQRRGYSADDLAQLFSQKGIAINAATLRGYLLQTRKKRRRGSKSARVSVVTASASPQQANAAAAVPASAPHDTASEKARR